MAQTMTQFMQPGSTHGSSSTVRFPPDGSSVSYASVPQFDTDDPQDRRAVEPPQTFDSQSQAQSVRTVTPDRGSGLLAGDRQQFNDSNSVMSRTSSRVAAVAGACDWWCCGTHLLHGTSIGAFYLRWRAGEWIITPEKHTLLDVWDIVVILALFGTAVVLPFEVALVSSPGPGLALFDNCINGVFMVDIVLTFNVAITHNDPGAHVVYEKDPLRIIGNYMAFPFSKGMTAGWFWPDIATVIPWDAFIHDKKSANSVRLLRVLRLVRMLRLVRIAKLFKRWHTYVGFSFALVKIGRCTCMTLMLVHWLACAWGSVGSHPEEYAQGATTADSWLTEIAGTQKVEDLSLFMVYTRSLYLCTVVLTTVGFGDITPNNSMEHVLMIVTMFITGLMWAFVVGNVVDVINNSDVYQTMFNQTMDDLNVLMSSRGVKNKLSLRIRKHLYESQLVHRQRHQLLTVTWLSESLQGELAIESGMEEVLTCVYYLRKMSTKVVIELAIYLKPDLFSPNEFIMDAFSLYVIRKGTAVRRMKLMQRGAVFGEDMILVTETLKDTNCPKTISFVEVISLGIHDLRATCVRFPDLDFKLRKAQIRLAFRRAWVQKCFRAKRDYERAMKKQAEKAGQITTGCGVKLPTRSSDVRNSSKECFQQEKVGWVSNMRTKRSGKDAERERRALVDLNDEFSLFDYAGEQAQDEALQNDRKMGELETLLKESQERSKERLNALDKRVDDNERFMSELMARLVQSPASPTSSRSGNKAPASPKKPK